MSGLLIAVLLGIVEGLTEYLPVSSTGHLIVAGHALGFTGAKADAFEIFIQLGAVLAVAWEYRKMLAQTAAGIVSPGAPGSPSSNSRRFSAGLLIAFLPAAVIGLATHHWIEENLFSPRAVAVALIAGGIAMLAVEFLLRRGVRPRYEDARALPVAIALAIGLAQVLSLYPGVSRSAATILGGLLVGLSRRAATEFSFFLALPTLGAACVYSLLKVVKTLTGADMVVYGVGLVVSFLVALLVIRAFLAWVKTRDFTPFAIYRIAFGCLVLALF
jgi:undecaprenyl-diphosphatase